MVRASLLVCLIALAACHEDGLSILESRDLAGADLSLDDLSTSGPDIPVCGGAIEGAACSVEGMSCGSCTNPCQFCNTLKCDGGKWTRIEAFPMSCDDMGSQDMAVAPACTLGNDPLPCSPSNDPCPQNGAFCDGAKHACWCITPVCTQGQDQTCNDDPAMSSFAGHCNANNACTCTGNNVMNPQTGKCRPSTCPATAPSNGSPCTTAGQQCSYPPNTTCTCVAPASPGESSWMCAF